MSSNFAYVKTKANNVESVAPLKKLHHMYALAWYRCSGSNHHFIIHLGSV